MPNYKLVGQEPGSYDCGYFTSFVVDLWDKSGGIEQMMDMTQDDVYRARNESRNRPDAPLTKSSVFSESLNTPQGYVAFLNFLGCRGYRAGSFNTVNTNQQDILQLLHSIPVYPSNDCLIVSLGLVHWIAVLARFPNGNYRVYNSARSGSKGFESTESDLVTILTAYGIWYYVGRHQITGVPAGNIDLNAPNPPGTPALLPGQRLHIVKPGDTLSQIAIQYYGDYRKYEALYAWTDEKNPNWNRREIGADVNVIRPGMRIIIPAKDAIR